MDLLARYRLNVLSEDLHVLHRLGMAQLDRPLVVLSCAAVTRGHAFSVAVHRPELANGAGIILSRGLLDPRQRLLEVHVDTAAKVVHHADLVLEHRATPLGTDLGRRHRPRVVDRHALAPEVDEAEARSRFGVALPDARVDGGKG